jgi:hypothetical protein
MCSYLHKIFILAKLGVTPAPATVPEEIIEEEAPVESGPPELDDLDDLGDQDDDPNEGCSNMDEWFTHDGSNDQD